MPADKGWNMKNLILVLVVTVLNSLALSGNALADTVRYSFSGSANTGAEDGFWNIANPGGTIHGIFAFDDSIFSRGSSVIEQEYPSAFVSFTHTYFFNSVLNEATAGTYPVTQQTARPDLRFIDSTSGSTVGFIYDNMDNGTFGYFLTMYFNPVTELNDQQDLVGKSGTAQYRNAWMPNSYYKYDFSVTGIVPVPEPGTYAMFLAGLGLLGAMTRRKKWPIAPTR
jgi:hypothetical protein